MAIGLVGRKCGMTSVFTEDGSSIPVTVIELEPTRVTQVKSAESDGYSAVQSTVCVRRASRVTKAMACHFAKAGVTAGRSVWEFRLDAGESASYQPGAELKEDLYPAGQEVDVTGVSIGKGFAGTIKRHHFTMGDATTGNSLSHRSPGSIGPRQTTGRVYKGKKMDGHLGHAQRTQQNLQVVRVDAERNLLLIIGAVPGSKGRDVIVKPAIKARLRGA